MSSSPDQHPKEIANRYNVQSILGEGAAGVVYLCIDSTLNKEVAIKMLHSLDSDRAIMRFHKEAVATAKLKHPSIATIMNFGEADGKPYMVMEYVEGKSLDLTIRENGAMDVEMALPIFIAIANGLASAHAAGIVHRDLKPSNVILPVNTEFHTAVKIVDFGLAKLQVPDQKLTNTGSYLGSPLYVSPEQARGVDVDERTDIYSFGCLMYETLTGEPPIAGDTIIETINLKSTQPAPSLREHQEQDFPDTLIEIVDACLEREPDKRIFKADRIAQKLCELVGMDVEQIAENELNFNQPAPEKIVPPFVIALTGILLVSIAAFAVYQSLTLPEEKGWPTSKVNEETTTTLGRSIAAAQEFDAVDAKVPVFVEDPRRVIKFRSGLSDAEIIKANLPKDTREVTLKEVRLAGPGMESIGNLPIYSLRIERSYISDEALRYLEKMQELKHLTLNNTTGYTAKGLLPLLSLPKLNYMQMDSEMTSDETLRVLTKLNGLESLLLDGSTKVTDASVPLILTMKKLNAVQLDNTGLSSKGVQRLCANKRLEDLGLNGVKLDTESFKAISRVDSLNRLFLRAVPITSEQLRLLTRLKKLNFLAINADGITHNDLRTLAGFPALTQLELNSLSAGVSVSEGLKGWKGSTLNLRYSDIKADELESLARLKNLHSLYLEHCKNLDDKPVEDFETRHRNIRVYYR